jgi:NTE family protein
VGLVLGGGAARGFAHVGVLMALEENKVPIHCIAGTSSGALAGGLFAAGVSATRLHALVSSLKWSSISSLSLPMLHLNSLNHSPLTLPLGFLDLDRLIEWIEEVVDGPLTFDQLNLPFAAIATDIVSGQMVIMNEGPLAPALRASCTVPGIFTPYRRNGRLLVDGGAINNLPVAAVQAMGAEYIIAVNLLALPVGCQMEPPNVLEVSLTALYALIRASQNGIADADCLIEPEIAHISVADIGAAPALVEAGYVAAQAAIPQILAALQ